MAKAKVRAVRLEEHLDRQLGQLLQRGEFTRQTDLIAELLEIGIITHRYLEARGITGIKSCKDWLKQQISVKQLKLPFDKY